MRGRDAGTLLGKYQADAGALTMEWIASATMGTLAAMMAAGATAQGPKMVEIDEHGNVDNSSPLARTITKEKSAKAPKPRQHRKYSSVCAPGYTWSWEGVSPDVAARTRAFYRDVTKPYEREQTRARETGTKVSRARDLAFLEAQKKFKNSVPEDEREAVNWGIEPRLSWWCDAPPVIRTRPAPQAPKPPSVPPPFPPIRKGQ